MADFTGKIKRIRIRKRRTGSGFKVVAKVEDDPEGKSMEVNTTFTNVPADMPQPVLENPDLPYKNTNANGVRRFVNRELTFTGGDPEEMGYTIEATPLDASGTALAPAETFQAVVEPNVAVGMVNKVRIQEKSNGKFKVTVIVKGNTDVDQVASVNVIFEEPYEGPAPLETEVNCALVSSTDGKRKFVYQDLEFDS
ncbi:MAG: hypothetical protein GY810_22620, partial [Aureispira sp.]|nr:hypothetical protein [Aureispira sp.]